PLSLHDALPISVTGPKALSRVQIPPSPPSLSGSFRPASFPECINASPRSHENPRESQPIEKSDKEDERKDEHGRLVVTPTVILAQAGEDNAQDGSQQRVLRRPPVGDFFEPQTRQVDLTVFTTLGADQYDAPTIGARNGLKPFFAHGRGPRTLATDRPDRKSTRLNSSHVSISYAVFCLKKKKNNN